MSLTPRKLIPARRSTAHYHILALLIIFSLVMAGFSPAVASPSDDFSAPNPISPAEGSVYTATGESGTLAAPPVAVPAFSWGGVAGATTYRIQVSQDIAFSTKVETTTPLTRWTPTNAGQFNDGLWYWRVKVESPLPGSSYSSPVGFSREWASPNNLPLLSSPANGANIEFLDANTFQWSPVLGAARYKFQISPSVTFTTLAYEKVTLATVHQPISKLAEGTYYWRVIPLDPATQEGTPSEIRAFTQLYNQVPTLIEPADDSFPTFTPTFHWQAVRGAQSYNLQYSTDPSFNTNKSDINTRNTQYTPTATLPNDIDYYWRVRASSGNSLSNWSAVWNFRKQWYLQTTLLTPINLYQLARFPFFSWTPVPGAVKYKIEMNTVNSFPGGQSFETSNPFHTFLNYNGSYGPRYWRVTPIDASNNPGRPSPVSSFVSFQDYNSPALIYPLYYYPPDPLLEPHEDRSVPQPIFQWNRVLDLGGFIYAPAYRIQVSTGPTFSSVVWDIDTENLVAAPTAGDDFSPDPNVVYYWRVCPLDSFGGACLDNGDPTTPIPWWSQAWKARMDSSLMPAATSGSGPELLRPRDLSELGEITPLLEWLPYQGADAYDVQISRFSDFSNILDSETVNYPAYAPATSFAQRSLIRNDFGIFYWRVRARSAGVPLGTWSTTRRFLIAAHSQWMNARSIGDPSNQLKIAEDAFGEVGVAANYDLTSLHAAQDKDFWYFGFNAFTSATDMKYVLYLDLDHTENSGATSDAEGYTVSTDPAFRPEYALYIHQTGGGFSAGNVVLYKWENNTNWVFVALLSGTAGGLDYDSVSNYVELKVESTGIGMGQDTGSLALALFSVPWGSGTPQDSVPATPGIPGATVLTHFASVTERLTASLPPDHTPNAPHSFSSVPPFFWEYPEVAPWAGVKMEVYLDQQFTTKIAEYTLTSTAPYYADNYHPWADDLSGDNTYYWRLRPRYLVGIAILGAWSEGKSFVRAGFIPTNLTESVTFATPTFSWDMAEGALTYDLQVDNDPNFGSLAFSVATTQNEYTPTNPLPNGTYYWRVRMKRQGGVTNEWSPAEVFNLSYPTPAGLTPHDPLEVAVVNRAPTLCWTPLIASQAGIPTLAAYKYRVQVSFGDPTFSTIYETVDTEQACYTPSKGYQDGKYYWRVAMIDGNTNLGPYSPTAEFTKQYPMANLIYPTSGDGVVTTPTFQWTVVSGAASYRLEISKNSTFSPLYDSITTNLVEFTPKKFYDINQTYFWRVAIIDADGKYGPFNNETIILDPLGGTNKIFLPLMRKN